MTEFIQNFGLTGSQWMAAGFGIILMGATKTGLSGLGLITVVIFAALFGGKASTGIVLPMLCLGDILAVILYNKHADFKLLFRLIPWVFLGIGCGLFTGNLISDQAFKITIGCIVLACIFVMLFLNTKFKKTDLYKYGWLAIPMGFAGGFATMIGNAAGPITICYFLLMKLPKNRFIGTGAWFYLVVNLFKLPMHYFFWDTISSQTLLLDLFLVPFLLLGGASGAFLVKRISGKTFNYFIQVTTIVSAAALILRNI